MLNNYIKTSFRSFKKHSSYGFLNIAGLAVGIACAAFIFLWVEDELSFNHQFAKRDQIYRILENQTYEGKVGTFWATPGPLAAGIKAEIPGIKESARLSWTQKTLFSRDNDMPAYVSGAFADPTLFTLLDLPFVKGNPATAFKELHSLVINERTAHLFFGDTDPIGKSLKVDNTDPYIITGVMKNLSENTTFDFEWLAPYPVYEAQNTWLKEWGNNGTMTFVELLPNANAGAVNKQLHGYINSKDKQIGTTCFLFAMNDWRLFSGFENGKQTGDGRIRYVRLFMLIAWIILAIACINFMNLSTARSSLRAREVGVRKVLGAGKGKLIGQFISESLFLSFIAVVLAVVIIYVCMPGFNTLVEKKLSLDLFNPRHFGALLAIGLLSGLVAGSYPAFFLSSFNPVFVLKGLKLKGTASAGFIRTGLVVTQFTVSIMLILATVVIYNQIQHIRHRHLGYDRENLVYMPVRGEAGKHFSAIKNHLIATGVVQNATLSRSAILSLGSNSSNFNWGGKDPAKDVLITQETGSPEYISTMGLALVSGRDFYANSQADSNSVIINEALAKIILKDNPANTMMTIISSNEKYEIIGVVKDFVYNDLYASSMPMMLYCNPGDGGFLTIRFKKSAEITAALAKVEQVMTSSNPGYPFEYTFVDAEFDTRFKTEKLIGKLSGMFAALAIFISCLGLFGLAAYTAERRTKEIGIRKIMGASISGLASLLSKDFMRLVMISCVIAFPLSWYTMNKWLEDYAYHTSIHWWMFVLTGVLALLIALVTVIFQAIKVALANPLNSLKSE
jgi:putative ABC transport system permease protein